MAKMIVYGEEARKKFSEFALERRGDVVHRTAVDGTIL